MKNRFQDLRRSLPALLMLLGIGLAVVAMSADMIRVGGRGGFGDKQVMLILLGGGLAAAGLFLRALEDRRARAAQNEILKRSTDIFLIAAWFGLFAGFGEVVILLIQGVWRRRLVHFNETIVWMAPLADLLLFAGLAVLLFVIARFWPRWVTLKPVVFVFAGLAFWMLLTQTGLLAAPAVFLLTIGLALQSARFASTHARYFGLVLHYTLGWTRFITEMLRRVPSEDTKQFQATRRHLIVSATTTIVGLAAITEIRRRIPEVRDLAALPQLAPTVPNVLLIVLDTVRARSMSLHGYNRRTTPALEDFAKHGVLFETAISTAPWTLPSHSSMFTGHYPHKLSAGVASPLDNEYPTIAEILAQRGYMTAGFVANTYYGGREFGLDRGFAHYEAHPVSAGELVRSSILGRSVAGNRLVQQVTGFQDILGRTSASEVSDNFLRWLQSQEKRPFFAFINYFDAHMPYLPPAEFARLYGSRIPDADYNSKEADKIPSERIREWQDAYDGAVNYLDYSVGQLLAQLKTMHVLDNTLVIITADHGEQFGEHGLVDHSNSLYMNLLHVPLLISLPSRVPSGLRIKEAVSLRDIGSTILDLSGAGAHDGFPGQSLARYWSTPTDGIGLSANMLLSEVDQGYGFPRSFPAMKGPMKSLVSGSMHYIHNLGDRREELYDIVSDPGEVHDLSGSLEGLHLLPQLRASMSNILQHG